MNVTDPDALVDGAAHDSKQFRIVVSEREDRTLLVPHGALDLATAPDLEAVLASQRGPVVIDLRELSFVDVTGLHVLLEADARSRQDGLQLSFIAGDAVRRLLECARIPDPLHYLDAPSR
jgi:anti-anti-sigma factor